MNKSNAKCYASLSIWFRFQRRTTEKQCGKQCSGRGFFHRCFVFNSENIICMEKRCLMQITIYKMKFSVYSAQVEFGWSARIRCWAIITYRFHVSVIRQRIEKRIYRNLIIIWIQWKIYNSFWAYCLRISYQFASKSIGHIYSTHVVHTVHYIPLLTLNLCQFCRAP